MAAREFRGDADLRQMQALTSEVWQLRGPFVEHHIGGLAWSSYYALDAARDARRALWEESARCVAWGWVDAESTLSFLVHPEHEQLVDDVLEWSAAAATTALESDRDLLAALERQGFRRASDAPFFAQLMHELKDLDEPELPSRFVARHVRGSRDLERRVAVHRAAWAPSEVTVESYARLMKTPPYRQDLDWVIETAEGEFAASCLLWLDETTGVAELEPVGTDPRFARRGLAAAVCLAALHRLRDVGGGAAMVHARGDPAYPAPKRLYESIGFREYVRAAPFRRSGPK